MKKYFLPKLILLLLLMQSCTTKKQILYLQDLDKYSNVNLTYAAIKIQPNDILKIEVSDLNPVVAAPFNININGAGQQSVEMMKLSGYLVSPEGNITMPILNEINTDDLSPIELEAKIKARLISEGYLVNPTVQVRVLNNKFTALGEFRSPGVISFTEGSISLLEAIGMAGDLTNTAIRKDVKIIRELAGKRIVYHVDLTSASWMSNADYRIRQNDVIVVMPNKAQINSGGVLKDPIQIIGAIATIVTLIILIK